MYSGGYGLITSKVTRYPLSILISMLMVVLWTVNNWNLQYVALHVIAQTRCTYELLQNNGVSRSTVIGRGSIVIGAFTGRTKNQKHLSLPLFLLSFYELRIVTLSCGLLSEPCCLSVSCQSASRCNTEGNRTQSGLSGSSPAQKVPLRWPQSWNET